MKTTAAFLLLCAISFSEAGRRLRTINLKTSDRDSTAGTDGTIRAKFYGCTGSVCETDILDNFLSNDHELGDLDVYDDEGTLGACYDFDSKSEFCNVFTAEVQMLNSDDGWLPEYIQFQDDTGAWVVECPLGKWIDDCSNCSSWGCCTLATSCYPVKREEQEDLVKPVQD